MRAMSDPAMSDPLRLARPSVAREVLARHGHRLGKSFGQHLLVDRRVLERILAVAAVGPGDVVLEVGPGIGTLTLALASVSSRVVAVEADRRLEPVLAETLADAPRVDVVWGDALKVVPSDLGKPPPCALIANLPYNVAATLVLDLLDKLPSIESATVMVQREVGERMAAVPGTKAYGAYTVKLALRASVRVAFRIGPSSFLPPPRVDSVVVRLERRSAPAGLGASTEPVGAPPRTHPPADVPALAVIDRVVDAAFGQRRKMLRSALAAGLSAPREGAAAALVRAGIEPSARAESLAPEEFVGLARACMEAGLLDPG